MSEGITAWVKGESFAVGRFCASVGVMKRENSESYGISASADAGVIAGLIAGAVEGRLTLGGVDINIPPRNIYLATKEDGKLKITGPGGKMVEELFKEAKDGNRGTFFHCERTSLKFFTTNTLAEHLNWTVGGSNAKDGLQPSRRFYAAFDVLTLILSARGRDCVLNRPVKFSYGFMMRPCQILPPAAKFKINFLGAEKI